MKKIIYSLLVLFTIFTVSIFHSELGLFNSSIEIKRPSHLPQNLPSQWGTYEQTAYLEGRLSYNADSSLCIISSDRILSPEHAEDFRKRHGVITFKLEE